MYITSRRITACDFDVGVVIRAVKRVEVVWRKQTGLYHVILAVTLPVVGTRRVEVDRPQENGCRALSAVGKIALAARRLGAAVADERLPVNAETDRRAHLAIAVVSEQNRPRLFGARVVRRQVGRVPAGLGADAQPEIGQGTELGVVETVEQRDDGRVEDGQLQRLSGLVDVGPVGRRVFAGLGRLESQPNRAVACEAHVSRVSQTDRINVVDWP